MRAEKHFRAQLVFCLVPGLIWTQETLSAWKCFRFIASSFPPSPLHPLPHFNLGLLQVVSPGHTQSGVLGLNSGMRYTLGRTSPQGA